MNPLARLLYGAGLRGLMDLIRAGTRARDALESAARQLVRGLTRQQYRTGITNARANVNAAETAQTLAPNQMMPVSQIPTNPYLHVDASIGERYRVEIEVEFQPMPGAPVLVRRTYWAGSAPPTGRDLAGHVAGYLIRQADRFGETPGSRGAREPGDESENDAELIGWSVQTIQTI